MRWTAMQIGISACYLDVTSAQHIWNIAVMRKGGIHELLQVFDAAAVRVKVPMILHFV